MNNHPHHDSSRSHSTSSYFSASSGFSDTPVLVEHPSIHVTDDIQGHMPQHHRHSMPTLRDRSLGRKSTIPDRNRLNLSPQCQRPRKHSSRRDSLEDISPKTHVNDKFEDLCNDHVDFSDKTDANDQFTENVIKSLKTHENALNRLLEAYDLESKRNLFLEESLRLKDAEINHKDARIQDFTSKRGECGVFATPDVLQESSNLHVEELHRTIKKLERENIALGERNSTLEINLKNKEEQYEINIANIRQRLDDERKQNEYLKLQHKTSNTTKSKGSSIRYISPDDYDGIVTPKSDEYGSQISSLQKHTSRTSSLVDDPVSHPRATAEDNKGRRYSSVIGNTRDSLLDTDQHNLDQISTAHEVEKNRIIEFYEQQIKTTQERHNKELHNLQSLHQEDITRLDTTHTDMRNEELKILQKSNEESVSSMNSKRDEEEAKLKVEITRLEIDIKNRDQNILGLGRAIERKEKEVHDCNEKNAALTGELAGYQQRLNEYEMTIKEREGQILLLEEELCNLHSPPPNNYNISFSQFRNRHYPPRSHYKIDCHPGVAFYPGSYQEDEVHTFTELSRKSSYSGDFRSQTNSCTDSIESSVEEMHKAIDRIEHEEHNDKPTFDNRHYIECFESLNSKIREICTVVSVHPDTLNFFKSKSDTNELGDFQIFLRDEKLDSEIISVYLQNRVWTVLLDHIKTLNSVIDFKCVKISTFIQYFLENISTNIVPNSFFSFLRRFASSIIMRIHEGFKSEHQPSLFPPILDLFQPFKNLKYNNESIQNFIVSIIDTFTKFLDDLREDKDTVQLSFTDLMNEKCWDTFPAYLSSVGYIILSGPIADIRTSKVIPVTPSVFRVSYKNGVSSTEVLAKGVSIVYEEQGIEIENSEPVLSCSKLPTSQETMTFVNEDKITMSSSPKKHRHAPILRLRTASDSNAAPFTPASSPTSNQMTQPVLDLGSLSRKSSLASTHVKKKRPPVPPRPIKVFPSGNETVNISSPKCRPLSISHDQPLLCPDNNSGYDVYRRRESNASKSSTVSLNESRRRLKRPESRSPPTASSKSDRFNYNQSNTPLAAIWRSLAQGDDGGERD